MLNATYITIWYDETERHINVRSCKHLILAVFTGKRFHDNKKYTVKDYLNYNNFAGGLHDLPVLDYKFEKLIKEPLLVSRYYPRFNKYFKSIPLEVF